MDTLQELIRSTLEFYARFDVQPQLESAVRVFREEVDELIEAAALGTDPAHIAEEAADVMVTAIGICLSRGVDPAALIEQAQKVVIKNDRKTHETHAVNEQGKIARRTD
ncbi:MAG: hypothetical protein KJ064_20575 [Anaerolineae bacterium]|nr:MAG: hypothetical protein F9K27_13000 [Anaerolineae bacterium]MCL4879065.1 hypothetical protein [Anaerolineae bacterium]